MEIQNTLTQDQLNEMIQKHSDWLNGNEEGAKADFSDMTLVGLDFSGRDLTSALFYRTDISESLFKETILDHAQMVAAIALKCQFKGATMNGIDASHTRFTGSWMHYVKCTDGVFAHSKLDGVFMAQSKFNGCDFRDADLSGSDATAAWFLMASFAGASVTSTIFDDCLLAGVIGDGRRIKSIQLDAMTVAYTSDVIWVNMTKWAIDDENIVEGTEYAYGSAAKNTIQVVCELINVSKAMPMVAGLVSVGAN